MELDTTEQERESWERYWREDGTPSVALLAEAVQVWTMMQPNCATEPKSVGDAALAFNTTPARIAEAVKGHPFMLLTGKGALHERRIEHDGE